MRIEMVMYTGQIGDGWFLWFFVGWIIPKWTEKIHNPNSAEGKNNTWESHFRLSDWFFLWFFHVGMSDFGSSNHSHDDLRGSKVRTPTRRRVRHGSRAALFSKGQGQSCSVLCWAIWFLLIFFCAHYSLINFRCMYSRSHISHVFAYMNIYICRYSSFHELVFESHTSFHPTVTVHPARPRDGVWRVASRSAEVAGNAAGRKWPDGRICWESIRHI